jgi:hypothetical protein
LSLRRQEVSMPKIDATAIIDQINSVLGEYETLKKSARFEDMSDQKPGIAEVTTRLKAVVERICGNASIYGSQIDQIENSRGTSGQYCHQIAGVVRALRSDIQAGYVLKLAELIHGELFNDFLEMADYLCTESLKDAAAVMAGGTLESHLRQLCGKHSIDTDVIVKGVSKPKKADRMNNDLFGASAYGKGDHKSILKWLDLRNDAAHARYNEYNTQQIVIMIAGIREFIERVPA